MYAIYKHDSRNPSTLVGICHTKMGAKSACSHFMKCYARENGHTFCRVEYKQVDTYNAIRIVYFFLTLLRKFEERKLRRLEYEERIAITEREAQSRKVASLY